MGNIYFLLISVSATFVAIFAIFLLHKGKKNTSNRILSIFFLSQLLLYINYMLIYLSWGNYKVLVHVWYLAYPVCWLWGPLFFHYIRSQTIKHNFKLIDTLHFIPFFIALIYIIIRYYIKDNNTKVFIITHYSLDSENLLFAKFYTIQLFIYNIAALKIFLDYRKRMENLYSSFNQPFTWLKYILFGYIAVCIVPATFNFTGQLIIKSYETKQIIIMFAFFFLFSFLFYQAIIRPYDFIIPVEKEKSTVINVSSEKLETYAAKLRNFMIIEKPYLNQSLSLKELSKAMGLNERILSQVIKTCWNQNFYSFINYYRIEEAKQLLKNGKSEKITMLGIAFESGFNSKSVFYDTFRKYTGMTPSDYRKERESSFILN